MELAIPLIALGGLYIVSKQKKDEDEGEYEEGFIGGQKLPNVDVPNKNFPNEYPIQTPEYSRTEKLTVDNKLHDSTSYTDKYFKPTPRTHLDGSTNSLENKNVTSVSEIEKMHLQNQGQEFTSMTGSKVDNDYFRHNNMVPFFGRNNTARSVDNDQSDSVMDNYLGKGTQQIEKKEQSPLFAPSDNCPDIVPPAKGSLAAMLLVTVVWNAASSSNAAANSFRVSKAAGAPSINDVIKPSA
jgi:hypothetical protein